MKGTVASQVVTDESGEVAAAAESEQQPKLQLTTRIPRRSFTSTDSELPSVCGLCALSDDDVLLAYSSQFTPPRMRAVSLRSQQLPSPREVSALENVYRVAYDALTDTLLCVCKDINTWLVLLRRNVSANDWLEVNRLRTPFELTWSPFQVPRNELVVCESRALLAQRIGKYKRRLHVFDLSAKHGLSAVGTVAPEVKFRSFACTRLGADTLVAFADATLVSLHRLATLQLESLSRIKLTDPGILVFRGNQLLVADWNEATKTHAIVPLLTAGGRLMRQPLLLDANDSVWIDEWCLAGDHLVVMKFNSNDLLLYAFE